MKLELTLGAMLITSIYLSSSFYQDKVDAEFRANKAEVALGKAVSDTNATKASYKQAIDKIDKIRKEAEREKCKLKSLTGGGFTIEL